MKKADKINILELESSLGFGGQEHRTQRVINGLNKDKFKVFYALNPGSKSFEKPIDCEFVEFNLSKVYNIFEIFKICRFVREKGISIAPMLPSLPECVAMIEMPFSRTKRQILKISKIL